MNLRKIRKAARDQGWTEEATRDGFFFVPPDPAKQKVLVHRDPPESSLLRAITLMKRQGFVWPVPPKTKSK